VRRFLSRHVLLFQTLQAEGDLPRAAALLAPLRPGADDTSAGTVGESERSNFVSQTHKRINV
jgi:hypothetical protein